MTPQKVSALALLTLAAIATPSLSFAQTTGELRGLVTDEGTGEGLGGVDISVTGPALQGEATAVTDGGGNYTVTGLPPGEYSVRFTFTDIVAERAGIVVRSEQTLALNVEMQTIAVADETYVVVVRAPTVDVGSTQIVTQVTKDLVRNTPIRGRTFEAVTVLAPGAASDARGPTFGGATGAENNYLVDGLNTTDVAFGLIATPLTLEFLEETNIITAGYRAEYGRANGAVVSLVTKSGSNEVKGSIWFSGQGLVSDPPQIARNGEAIAVVGRSGNRALDFGFELGGPIVEDWIWFYAGVAPSLITDRYTRSFRTRTADQISSAEGEVYAGDTDISGEGFVTRDVAGSAVDMESSSRALNYITKLDLRFSDEIRASVTYLGTPSTFDGVLSNPRNPNSDALGLDFNADPSVVRFQENISVHDLIARTSAKLFDGDLELEFTGGFHSQRDELKPSDQRSGSVDDARTVPLTTYEDVEACKVQDIGGVLFDPCPVSAYRSNGFGFYNDLALQRFVLGVQATYFLELEGSHAIKIGGDWENNRYESTRAYTGGPNGGRFDILDMGGGVAQRIQFGTIDEESREVVLTPNGFTAKTRTVNESIFLQDSYAVGFVPGLTIDLGVRWEFQQLMSVDGATATSIDDNIAPRVGVIYDWTQRGHSKIFANYGRFFESIPLDVNDRQFSREALVAQYLFPGDPGYCRADANGKIDATTCNYPAPVREDAFGGELALVQPNLKGQYTDQISAGVEYDVGMSILLGAAFIHKELGRVVEDLSPDGGWTYITANPGSKTDPDVVRELQNRVTAAKSALDQSTTPEAREVAQRAYDRAFALLTNYQAIESFPEATRTYNALQFTARKRLTRNWQMLASYTYSRTTGNYPGLFQASNNQLDPNTTTQYDLKDLLVNRDGPLPSDRPHNIKIAGSYFLPLGENPEDGFTFGGQFSAISGAPIEVLGRHPLYGVMETFILPRGSGGRTPWITALDLRLGYQKELGSGYKLEIAWDIFNVLNQRAVVAVDEEYTSDFVLPIPRGTTADLTNLRSVDGNLAKKSANYGQPLEYQAPIAMRIGTRITF